MPHLVGTRWHSLALIIHILDVDETRVGAELTIRTEPQSGTRTSLQEFWTWVEMSHAECDQPVAVLDEGLCLT